MRLLIIILLNLILSACNNAEKERQKEKSALVDKQYQVKKDLDFEQGRLKHFSSMAELSKKLFLNTEKKTDLDKYSEWYNKQLDQNDIVDVLKRRYDSIEFELKKY